MNIQAEWVAIPRSREVKQGRISAVFTTLWSFAKAFATIVRRYRGIDLVGMDMLI